MTWKAWACLGAGVWGAGVSLGFGEEISAPMASTPSLTDEVAVFASTQTAAVLPPTEKPAWLIRAERTFEEGVLAETGYHAIFWACQRKGVLPGLQKGIENVKRDESRHIAYGIYALQQLIRQDPTGMEFVTDELNGL